MWLKQILFLVLFFCAFGGYGQTPRKLRFEKDRSLIYFFQLGAPSDTITKEKTDRFVLLVPDSMKEQVRIDLDNAKIQAIKDSLVTLMYLPGLRYEAIYARPYSPLGSPVEKPVLNVQINGAAQLERKKIRVQFIDRRNNKLILENQFSGE